MTTRGFTLLEILGVLALLSLAWTVGIGRLSDVDRATQQSHAVSIVRSFDARARLSARTGGAVTIEVEQDALVLRRDVTGEVLAKESLPRGVLVRISGTEGLLRFDARGVSADAELTLAADGRARTFRVHGLTGVVVEEEP